MSQIVAYKILQELGGTDIPSKPVHIKAITLHAQKHYPLIYSYKHVASGMSRLCYWKYAEYHHKTRSYRIIEKFPDPQLITIKIEELEEEEE